MRLSIVNALIFVSICLPGAAKELQAEVGQAKRQLRFYSVTPLTAPERAVYTVFAAELVQNEKNSRDQTLPEDARDRLRRKLQFIAGVKDSEYAELKTISMELVANLDKNSSEGASVFKEPHLSPAERKSSLLALKARRDELVDEAIDKWKQLIGPRFRSVDRNIRAYVAPGLHLGYLESEEPTEAVKK